MFRPAAPALLLLLVGACASSRPEEAAPGALAAAPAREIPPPLSPAEIIRRMEASKVKYTVRPLEDCGVPETRIAATLWPRRAPEYQFPVVSFEPNGQAAIRELTAPAEAFRFLQVAEEPFQAKRWDEAAAAYERALAVDPRFVPALLYEGDTFLLRGRPEDALPFYARARQANPADHRGFYFAANALIAQGRVEDAVSFYAEALARRPRHESLRMGIESRLVKMGRRLRGDVVPFKGFARKTEQGVEICTRTTPPWVAWSMCKGYWLGDADHRREMLGSDLPVFSTTEESECLLALLHGYDAVRANHPDPDLEELREIALAGRLHDYVMIELATRLDPHAALRVRPEKRHFLVSYVLAHVLVEGAAPPAPVKGGSDELRQARR